MWEKGRWLLKFHFLTCLTCLAGAKSSSGLHKALFLKTFFHPVSRRACESYPTKNLQSLLGVFHVVTVTKETRGNLATWAHQEVLLPVSSEESLCFWNRVTVNIASRSCLHCCCMEPWLQKHKWQQQEQISIASLKKCAVLGSIISRMACIYLGFRWSCIGATYPSVFGFLFLSCTSRRSKREII